MQFVQQEGPLSLDSYLNPCHEDRGLSQNLNPIIPTPKSILGITQIITKAYPVTRFNQNILICTIFFAYGQTFYLHKVQHFFPFNFMI